MSSLSSSLSFSIGSSSSTISLSIAYGDENRQMWFPTSMSWNDVRSSILSCYLLSGMASDYRFSYTDEEGDAIAIEHDSEFIEAKRSAASKGSYLQLSLVRVAQNGAPLSSNGRSKDDFASLEDNSDLEESYVSVNDISKTPSNQSIVVIEEKKDDNAPMADAIDEKKDENIIDDALSALQEAEQQQIKIPVNDSDEKASPPSLSEPIILTPAVVQESSVSSSSSSLANESAPLEPKKSQNIDAALCAISSVFGKSDAQEGLVKAITFSLINYSVSIASPSDADLIRSHQSLLEERVNDGVKGRINNGLLARLLIRRLFSPKKTKAATKRNKSLKPSKDDTEQKPVVAPSSSHSSSPSSSSGRAVHLGVSCDVCNIGPIVGARYHCITCDENDEIRKRGGWDCCEECETKTNHCTTDPVRHVLIKMKTPAKIVVEKEQPSQHWIESGQPVIYDAFAHFGDESKAVPVGVVNDCSINEPQKAEKKRGKKYAKKMIQMLLQQFDDSLTCSSDSSSDDESAQRKLAKKMEKQKKKAEKALRRAEKLKMKADKKAGKAAEKSDAKMDEEKKENVIDKKDVMEKKEENKEEAKENQQVEQLAITPSNVPEKQSSIQVDSAAAAASPPTNNPETVIKTESSSSSSSSSVSSSSSPSVDAPSSISEQKADLPFPILPVPLPVAHAVIAVPPPPPASSLPSILPAPFFPPAFHPPFNPFTFPPVPASSVPSSSLPPSPPSPPLFFAYPDQLAQLTAMGFPRERSMELLNYYSGDLRKALNRLL